MEDNTPAVATPVSSLSSPSSSFTSVALSLLFLLKDYTSQTSEVLETLVANGGEIEMNSLPRGAVDDSSGLYSNDNDDDEEDEDPHRQQWKWVQRRTYRLQRLVHIMYQVVDSRARGSGLMIGTSVHRALPMDEREPTQAARWNGTTRAVGPPRMGFMFDSMPVTSSVDSTLVSRRHLIPTTKEEESFLTTSSSDLLPSSFALSVSSFSPFSCIVFPPVTLLVRYLSCMCRTKVHAVLTQLRGWGARWVVDGMEEVYTWFAFIEEEQRRVAEGKEPTSSLIHVSPLSLPCMKIAPSFSLPHILWQLYSRNKRVASRKRPRVVANTSAPVSGAVGKSESKGAGEGGAPPSLPMSPPKRTSETEMRTCSVDGCPINTSATTLASVSEKRTNVTSGNDVSCWPSFTWTSPPMTVVIREKQQDWRHAVYTCQSSMLNRIMADEGVAITKTTPERMRETLPQKAEDKRKRRAKKEEEEERAAQLRYTAKKTLSTLNMAAEARLAQRAWIVHTKAQLLFEWEPLAASVKAMQDEWKSLLRGTSVRTPFPSTTTTPAISVSRDLPYFFWREVQQGIIRIDVQHALTMDITYDIWKGEWRLLQFEWSIFTPLPVEKGDHKERIKEQGVEKEEEEKSDREVERDEGWRTVCDEDTLSDTEESSTEEEEPHGKEEERWHRSPDPKDVRTGGAEGLGASTFQEPSTLSSPPLSSSLLFRLQPDHQREMGQFLQHHLRQGGIREGCLAANRLVLCVSMDTIMAQCKQVQSLLLFPSRSRSRGPLSWDMEVIPGTHVAFHWRPPDSALWCTSPFLETEVEETMLSAMEKEQRATVGSSFAVAKHPTGLPTSPPRDAARALLAGSSTSSVGHASREGQRREEWTTHETEILHGKIFIGAGKVVVQHHWGTDLRTQCTTTFSQASPTFRHTVEQLQQHTWRNHHTKWKRKEWEDKKQHKGEEPSSPGRTGGTIPSAGAGCEEEEEVGMILDAEQMIWELVRRRRQQKIEEKRKEGNHRHYGTIM